MGKPTKPHPDVAAPEAPPTPLTTYEEAAFVMVAARLPKPLKESCASPEQLTKLFKEGGLFNVAAFLLPVITSDLAECDGTSLVLMSSSYTLFLYLADYVVNQLHFLVDHLRFNHPESWNYKTRLCFNCFAGVTIAVSRNNDALRFIELLWRPPSADAANVTLDCLSLLSPMAHRACSTQEKAAALNKRTFLYQSSGFADIASKEGWVHNDRLWNNYRSIYQLAHDSKGNSLSARMNRKSKEESQLLKLQTRLDLDDHIKSTEVKWVLSEPVFPLALTLELALQNGWVARTLDLVLHAYLELAHARVGGTLVTLKTKTELMANMLASRTVATILAASKRERKQRHRDQWRDKAVRPCWFLPHSFSVLPGGEFVRLLEPRQPIQYHYESGEIHTFTVYRSSGKDREKEDIVLKLAILAEPDLFKAPSKSGQSNEIMLF